MRFDEFFGGERGSRRPLAPLRALQTNGHEQRLTHLSRMCGTVLGSRRRNFKLPPNTLVVPRELFTRTSHLVGLPRVSCDMMTQAALSLHLGRRNNGYQSWRSIVVHNERKCLRRTNLLIHSGLENWSAC